VTTETQEREDTTPLADPIEQLWLGVKDLTGLFGQFTSRAQFSMDLLAAMNGAHAHLSVLKRAIKDSLSILEDITGDNLAEWQAVQGCIGALRDALDNPSEFHLKNPTPKTP
jgi:hypothetical protein